MKSTIMYVCVIICTSLLVGCVNNQSLKLKEDKYRFARENRYCVRILKLCDDGSYRRCLVAGIRTNEQTYMEFDKNQETFVEVNKVVKFYFNVSDDDITLHLSIMPVVLED